MFRFPSVLWSRLSVLCGWIHLKKSEVKDTLYPGPFTKIGPTLEYFYQPRSLAKQGYNGLGSVRLSDHLSIRPPVTNLMAEEQQPPWPHV